jgi:hypothetical protein
LIRKPVKSWKIPARPVNPANRVGIVRIVARAAMGIVAAAVAAVVVIIATTTITVVVLLAEVAITIIIEVLVQIRDKHLT